MSDSLDEIEAHTLEWGRRSRLLTRLALAASTTAIAINLLAVYRGGPWWAYVSVVWLAGLAIGTVRSHVRYARHRDETLLWVARRRMEREGP